MNDYQSIYTNHYEGHTYRFAVAYLVDGTRMNALNPKKPFPSLTEQRDRIAAFAQEHSSIVVKEFIETEGDEPLRNRAGFMELAVFVAHRFPALVMHAGEDTLNLRAGERYIFVRQLGISGTRVMSAA